MKKGKASLYKNTIFGGIEAHGEVSIASGVEEFTSVYVKEEIARMMKCSSSDILI